MSAMLPEAKEYKDKRMKLPEASKYVNDFDRLCLSNELYPDKRDDEPIYLGVEALGWLWL